MRDERDDRLNRLLRTVRDAPPDISGVAEGFEVRFRARLRERRSPREPWTAWTWRLAPFFLALALVLGAWNLFPGAGASGDIGAGLATGAEEVALVSNLTGE